MRVSTLRTSCLALSLALCASPALAATFNVVNTFDAGAGSFRQALIDANTTAGADTIAFAIPNAGVHTIALASALPDVVDQVFINGYSQPGSSANTNALGAGINAVPQIELDFSASLGLVFASGSAGSIVRGLVINHTPGDNVTVSADNVTIAGNFIGTNAAGTLGLPGVTGGLGVRVNAVANTTIGGPNAADRNLISGNSQGSVILPFPSTTGHLIQGNYVGTDVTGTVALNTFSSSTTGLTNLGNASVLGNLVSGSLGGGIRLFSNNVVQGNLVGTKRDGVTALPNGNFGGFSIDGDNSTIGGAAAGEGNVIAFNVNSGIDFNIGTFGNRISGNSIHSNGALGITLVHGGTPYANDPGDADVAAANHGQNYPVIVSASITAGTATISGSLNSNASTALRVEFFASVACDPSGNGEGQTYLGFTDVNTDAGGNALFGPLPFAVPAGQAVITSTATSPAGDTSEFSACLTAVASGAPDLTIAKTHAGSFVQGSSGNAYTVTVTNAGAGDKLAAQAVSVTDTPPAGLTVTAMSGTGWTCTTLPTCTRSDLLAAGNSYPAITVIVSVTAGATSPQINSVTVTTAQAESSSANNTATDSATIVAAALPDLTLTKAHAGSFVQGSVGNAYTVTVSNTGGGSKTAGQSVSVTDAPPAGLTVTAMSGSGWNCTTLPTCTRSDALAAGNSYPTISVTVSVAGAATSPQINAVTVTTTQAESSSANNTATDSTTIVPVVVVPAVVDHAIPTLSDWALVGIALLLAALAAGHLRRRPALRA